MVSPSPVTSMSLFSFLILLVFVAHSKGAPTAVANSQCGFDIAFILDSSQSISEINFPNEKVVALDVAKRVLREIGGSVGSSGTQVSVVTFNTDATVRVYLNQSQSLDQLTKAFDSFSYAPGLSNPYAAFYKITHEVFVASAGDRQANPNVIVYISDGGITNGAQNPIPLAELFRLSGGDVMAIGMGGFHGMSAASVPTWINYNTLEFLTGSATTVFNSTTYTGPDGIASVFKNLATTKNLC